MNNGILRPQKKLIASSRFFRAYQEAILRKNEQKRFLAEADKEISSLPDTDVKAKIRKAYVSDLKKYMFNFSEWYYQYSLYGKPESEKSSYISRSCAQKWYRRLVTREMRELFYSKPLFINRFTPPGYIRRKTMTVGASTSAADLKTHFSDSQIIVKPMAGSLGNGVYKLSTTGFTDKDWSTLLGRCISENAFIEQCIEGDNAMQQFHPQSLNTIRLVTAWSERGAHAFGSFVRFGRGDSVIDNAHGGGVYCTVNLSDGSIMTDAFDVDGNCFENHPDTGIRFKGFIIPRWEEIVTTCCTAHNSVDIPFVGWDVCINKGGEIEFIEGNHAPDMDIIQGPLKTGFRLQFETVCRNYETMHRTTHRLSAVKYSDNGI